MSPIRRTFDRRALFESAGALLLAPAACIPQGDIKRPLEMTPRDIGDGWEISTPEAEGLDPSRVRSAYERVFSEDHFYNALSLLVIARGRLVAEGYVQDEADRTRKEHVQSCTKSVTSLAFGKARELGYFPDLDAPLADFLSVPGGDKQKITLRHLLTMRSGISVDNDEFNIEINMHDRKNVTEWLLSRPLLAAPGAKFEYRDCDPQLIGAAVLAETGQSIERLARDAVFAPLGIHDIHWEHDADDEPLTAHGLWFRPRDFAKFGELVHRRGVWQGEAVLASDWIGLATEQQTEIPQTGNTKGFGYGFYFWTVPELSGYSTWGHGGNFTLVVPDREVVLVMTSMPDAGDDIGSELRDIVDLGHLMLAHLTESCILFADWRARADDARISAGSVETAARDRLVWTHGRYAACFEGLQQGRAR